MIAPDGGRGRPAARDGPGVQSIRVRPSVRWSDGSGGRPRDERSMEPTAIDEARFVELVIGGLNEAHRVATWILGDPAAAEDAVQDAAARAWAGRTGLRDPAAVSAWFGRIVVNTCRDELRRRNSRPRTAAVGLADDVADPSVRDAEAADRDEIARAIRRLKPDFQVVLALRFGADLTVPAIADRLGIPEGTAKTRLRDALAAARVAIAAERAAASGPREARR